MSHARLEGSFLSTGPIQPGIRARHKDGVYFAGNIAGEAHPVIAEGISMAIQSSGLLTRMLIAHRAMRGAGRLAGLVVLRAAPGLLDLGARISGKRPLAA